jgi:hypothetical protein
MVIRTDLLRQFPSGVHGAINNPESGGRVLVAVEAGIKIRDLCPGSHPAVIDVTAAPMPQPLRRQVALEVRVRDDGGVPITGASVRIENFSAAGRSIAPVLFATDASGLAAFSITFNEKRQIDPLTHESEVVEQPSGTVAAGGFQGVTLPPDLTDSVTPPPSEDPDQAPWLPLRALRRGRELTLPMLGGAAGQSLAGDVSTATRGGDVARPPIGDFVRALVVVGSGGVAKLLQRAGSPPVVDFGRRSIMPRLGPRRRLA